MRTALAVLFVLVGRKTAGKMPALQLRDGGAGVAYVGVEGFDGGGEFLFDDAAFEFHGEG